MTRRVGRRFSTSLASIAILLIMMLLPDGLTISKAHAIVVGPSVPSWVLPGEYLEYNQSYAIGGLTASVNVKETFLNSQANMRIQRFGPHLPAGFAMPGLVSPYDTADQPPSMLCHTVSRSSSSSSVQCTTEGIQSGSSDPTAFVDEHELAYAKATVVPLRLAGPGS